MRQENLNKELIFCLFLSILLSSSKQSQGRCSVLSYSAKAHHCWREMKWAAILGDLRQGRLLESRRLSRERLEMERNRSCKEPPYQTHHGLTEQTAISCRTSLPSGCFCCSLKIPLTKGASSPSRFGLWGWQMSFHSQIQLEKHHSHTQQHCKCHKQSPFPTQKGWMNSGQEVL